MSALVFCLGAFAPAAAAQTSGGGGVFVSQPKVLEVSCVSKCATKKRAQGGSSLKISGSGLASAAKVIFHGSYGKRDDVTTPVRRRGDRPRQRDHGPGRDLAALCAYPDPPTAASRPQRRPEPGARADRCWRPRHRDGHEPDQGIRGRPPCGDLLL